MDDIDAKESYLQFVFLFLRIFLLLASSGVDDVGKEVTDLWVDWLHRFPLENRADPLCVLVAQSRHKDGIETIKVSGEVPEASFPTESPVDQHVEAIDPKQRRISLAARENIQRWMAESDVSNNV